MKILGDRCLVLGVRLRWVEMWSLEFLVCSLKLLGI